jgi:hypothetical protein
MDTETEEEIMAAITEFGGCRVGDEVMIYEDPVTRQKPEGRAILVALWSGRSRTDGKAVASRWTVRFIGHERDGVFDRIIHHD